jgi:tetratricopeptide (TPR) repeat protein
MGERFVFVPSLGFVIAFICGLNWLRQRFSESKEIALVIAVGCLALLFTVRTIARNPVWKDDFTLFTTDVANSPNSAKVQTSAGGTLNEAVGHLKKAIQIYPTHGQAHLLLGNAYFNLEKYREALDCYETAWNHRPYLWDCYTNAAITARKIKRYDVASFTYQLMASRQTDSGARPSPALWFDIGFNYEEWGKSDSALIFYQKALDNDPKMAKAFGQMARVYGMQLGNFDKAIEFGEKAVAAEPRLEWAWENLGVAHGMKKDYMGAIEVFNRGISANPKGSKLFLNRAITYQNLGDSLRAKSDFNQAFTLDPTLRPK